jgi:RNA polymerase sigma-70 factor (ECF subfamily)
VTDADLARRAREGDSDAFGELVDLHRGAVFRAARAALGSHAEAEDAAQEAFVIAYRRLATFRGEASFRTWLLAIAWRHALRRRRSLALRLRRFPYGTDDESTRSQPPDDARSNPQAALETAELTRHVRRLVGGLPGRLRDPLLLMAAGDHTYDEAAALTGVPAGTLKWRVAEARRMLRERLVGLGYADE